MATNNSDFVDIQLTAAGVKMAGAGATLRIAARHISYTFKVGSTTQVLTSEWTKFFSKQLYQGAAVVALATTSSSGDAQTEVNTLKAEVSELEATIAKKGGK